jgi:hypothetical protein
LGKAAEGEEAGSERHTVAPGKTLLTHGLACLAILVFMDLNGYRLFLQLV